MRLPYGISNFGELRRHGYVFVDKTRFIRNLEAEERGRRYLVFLRPRRMGKTLLLSMLEHYYDVLRADEFDTLFDGLDIARAPTADRNAFLTLRLELTKIDTQGGVDRILTDFHDNLRSALAAFAVRYQALVPALRSVPELSDEVQSPAVLMAWFLSLIQQSSYQLYLFIDEYDNFTNDLIARGDEETYRTLLHAAGFVREFYKAVKEGTATAAIGRILITGVSPVTLDDLTSGFNISKNVSLDADLNELCGFTRAEVTALASDVLRSGGYALEPLALVSDLARYYDGYLFSRRATEHLFNPDMVLHFLTSMTPPAGYPEEILDLNVRTDYGRIRRLLFTPEGAPRRALIEVYQAVLVEGSILTKLHRSFPLERAYEEDFFLSLLYYMGLLTLQMEEGWVRLAIPNYVVRTLFWDAIALLLRDLHHVDLATSRLDVPLQAMAVEGDIGPFLELVFSQVILRLSNRDLIRLDEKTMKVILLAYLSLTDVFFAWSEVEVSFGYGDLALVPNPAHPVARYAYLIELKYLKAGAGAEAVAAKLTEADAQLRRYLAEPKLGAVAGAKGWKAVSVAFVGTEACWFRELGGDLRGCQRAGSP